MTDIRPNIDDGLYWIRVQEGTDDAGITVGRKRGDTWQIPESIACLKDREVFAVYAPAVAPMIFIGDDWPEITDARQLSFIAREMVDQVLPIANRFPSTGDFSIALTVKRRAGKALADVTLNVLRNRKKK